MLSVGDGRRLLLLLACAPFENARHAGIGLVVIVIIVVVGGILRMVLQHANGLVRWPSTSLVRTFDASRPVMHHAFAFFDHLRDAQSIFGERFQAKNAILPARRESAEGEFRLCVCSYR